MLNAGSVRALQHPVCRGNEAIKALRAALERVNQSYWAGRPEEQIPAIPAWVTLREDAPGHALKFLHVNGLPVPGGGRSSRPAQDHMFTINASSCSRGF